jgi:transcriptional regulator with XRE-family HTH domain
MRRARRLTGAQLAAIVGMSQPKISRIERGRGLPDPGDVGALARALGADEDRARALMERAERSHDRMTDWRPTSAVLASRQNNMADWESAAEVVRDFQPVMLAGLLQTSGYAKATLQVFQRLAPLDTDELTESAVLAAVSARIRRQEVLADQSRSFRFVITEAVLRTAICTPAEMLAQIGHLREIAARRGNVSIAVVPDGAPVDVPPMHGFTLLDDKLIVVDIYNTGLISRGRKDLESYRRVFDVFDDRATAIEPTLDKYEALYVERLRG